MFSSMAPINAGRTMDERIQSKPNAELSLALEWCRADWCVLGVIADIHLTLIGPQIAMQPTKNENIISAQPLK